MMSGSSAIDELTVFGEIERLMVASDVDEMDQIIGDVLTEEPTAYDQEAYLKVVQGFAEMQPPTSTLGEYPRAVAAIAESVRSQRWELRGQRYIDVILICNDAIKDALDKPDEDTDLNEDISIIIEWTKTKTPRELRTIAASIFSEDEEELVEEEQVEVAVESEAEPEDEPGEPEEATQEVPEPLPEPVEVNSTSVPTSRITDKLTLASVQPLRTRRNGHEGGKRSDTKDFSGKFDDFEEEIRGYLNRKHHSMLPIIETRAQVRVAERILYDGPFSGSEARQQELRNDIAEAKANFRRR